MKRIALYLGIAAALVASCSIQEENFETPQQEDVIYYATFEQPADEGTRVYANEDLLLRWTADDRVSIFGKNTYNQQYKFLGETGDNSGGFSKVDGAEYVTGNPLSHTVSVYPYQAATKITEDEVLTVTLPAEQHYAENTFGLGDNTMISVSADNVLQYKNVGGYLMLKLYGEGVSVSSITLKGNNGEKLAGKATGTMPLGGVPSVVLSEDSECKITLVCGSPVTIGASPETATPFWMIVPPTVFENGFTLMVQDENNGFFKKSTSKRIEVIRNSLSTMAAVEVDFSYDIINFADDRLKERVVGAYDTNHDGELSLAEAESVTSLDRSVCQGDNDFTSFDEFRYFTGVTSIPGGFFSGWSQLRSITLPKSITSIGMVAFNECTSLTSIIIPEGVTYLPTAVFRECSRLSSVVLPNSLVSIGTAAFALCSSLETITIPEGVQRIESAAFGDSGLRSVSLPTSLHIIEGQAFQNCTNLTSVIIPESVDIIYNRVFSGCSSMESIHLLSEAPPSITDDTFDNSNDCPIYVPAESVEAYKSAEYWSDYADRIQAIPSSVPIPEAIDLGLPSGLKWGSFNLGATKPEENGDYYAWGETEPKDDYSWSTYKWCEGSGTSLTKYCNNPSYGFNGFADDNMTLILSDDPARLLLGEGWRMPTVDEMQELRMHCTWELKATTIYGYRVKSKTNNNSIFLPASGMMSGLELKGEGTIGYYWTSSLLMPDYPWYVCFFPSVSSLYDQYRCYGMSIRPVYAE